MTDPSYPINELKSILDNDKSNEFQRALHYPVDNEELNDEFITGDGRKHERIRSRFFYQFKKIPYGIPIREQLNASIQNSNIILFTPNEKYDHLLHTYIVQKLPELKLKKEFIEKGYYIRYTHNPGHNIIKEANMSYDGDVLQTITSTYLDIWSELYMKSGFDKFYSSDMIGNCDHLQYWSTRLPEDVLVCPQPWSYTRHIAVSVPLYFKPKLQHRYVLRNSLDELIQIAQIVDNKIELKTFKKKYFENVPKLPQLELWGYYIKNSFDEIEDLTKKPRHVYTEDIIVNSSNNIVYDNTEENIEINLTNQYKTTTKALFVLAENQYSLKYNGRSNYTTNPFYVKKGYNPITKISLRNNSGFVYKDMESYHFDRADIFYRFKSPPSVRGYNPISFSMYQNSLHADYNLLVDSSTLLSCKIGTTDPFYNDEEDSDSEEIELTNNRKDVYKIHVVQIIQKRVRHEKISSDKFDVRIITGIN
jgi:hypothetical protein